MTETQYAIAWYRMRLSEAYRVPMPDRNWLKPRRYRNAECGLFDNMEAMQ